MKNLTELWKAYDNGVFGQQELQYLSWHIENNKDPRSAMSMATDIGLKQVGSIIAKHLDHPDWSIREFTLGCLLKRLKISEYAEEAFRMATSDIDEGVKSTAISCLGSILDNLDKSLQQKIGSYIYSVIINKEYDTWYRRGAYDAVTSAMEVPIPQRRYLGINNFDYQVDYDFLKDFCKKYQVSLDGNLGGSKNAMS